MWGGVGYGIGMGACFLTTLAAVSSGLGVCGGRLSVGGVVVLGGLGGPWVPWRGVGLPVLVAPWGWVRWGGLLFLCLGWVGFGLCHGDAIGTLLLPFTDGLCIVASSFAIVA